MYIDVEIEWLRSTHSITKVKAVAVLDWNSITWICYLKLEKAWSAGTNWWSGKEEERQNPQQRKETKLGSHREKGWIRWCLRYESIEFENVHNKDKDED